MDRTFSKQESIDRNQQISKFLQQLYENACAYKDSKNRNRQRVSGTCEWFTSHSLFKRWNSPTDEHGEGLLFVTADPGCGKSVLSRYLVDEVLPDHRERIVCYFFFKDDFEHQKSALRAICTVLHQIFVLNRSLLTEDILRKHEDQGAKFFESFSDMWSVLLVAAAAAHQDIVCVLDALDECQHQDRTQLIDAITRIYDTSSNKSTGSSTLRFSLD